METVSFLSQMFVIVRFSWYSSHQNMMSVWWPLGCYQVWGHAAVAMTTISRLSACAHYLSCQASAGLQNRPWPRHGD